MSKTEAEAVTAKTFITIEIGDLATHGKELGDALVRFIGEKFPKDVKTSKPSEKEIYVRSDKTAHPSKTKLRVYLKRFLHLNNLRDDLIVLVSNENIRWFDIPMDDTFLVGIMDSRTNLLKQSQPLLDT